MEYNDTYTEFLNLYKLSETPYSPKKSYSTCKEFKSSFNKVEKEFKVEELKQLVRLPGIEPGSIA